MLFSYNKNMHFPPIKIGNNTIGETFVIKFLGIHLNNRLNFKNRITEFVPLKAAASIGLFLLTNFTICYTIITKLLFT